MANSQPKQDHDQEGGKSQPKQGHDESLSREIMAETQLTGEGRVEQVPKSKLFLTDPEVNCACKTSAPLHHSTC